MAGAATVADQIKQTSHMFVIGVGVGVTDALSALRIQAVSGTKSFPTYPISTADYTLVTDFGELEDALGEIASNLCNVTVTVEKETDDQARDSWVDKPGWGFSGRTLIQPPASQFAYKWFEPNVVDPVNTTTATQSGATGADGRLRFVWRPTAADSLSNITVSEGVPAAYTPHSVTCVLGGIDDLHQPGSGDGGVVHPPGAEGARQDRLHGPKPPQALHRARCQELGWSTRVGDDLRRRHGSGAV